MSTSVFRDHIEQAVRPVRALESRKDRMGEELSAHLAASFEEERARLGDDRAAAERAIQRLGKVSELTRSLQESVPRFERLLSIRLPSPPLFDAWDRASARRSDEALSRYAARITVCLTAFGTVGALLGVLAASVGRARPMDWPVILVWAVAALVVCAAGTFVSPFLCEGMAYALLARSSRRSRQALYALLSSFTVIVLMLSFVLIVSVGAPHGQVFHRSNWLTMLAMALLAPIILTLGAQSFIGRRRRRDGWRLPEISP
jgi:MFS family permease